MAMRFRFFFCFFFFCTQTIASNVVFKIPKQKRSYLTYLEACQKLGLKNNLLIDPIGVRALNCMGKKVEVSEACEKEKNGKLGPFIRGVIDVQNRQVICQYGKQAFLSISCEGHKNKKFCKRPKKSCLSLQKKFAGELNLAHFSRLFKGHLETLNCYYSYSKNEKKDHQKLLKIPQELSF